MALFLHGPLNCTVLSKNLPCGTWIVEGFVEAQAADQAVDKAEAESVAPSGFAPKSKTLYVVVVMADDWWRKRDNCPRKRMTIRFAICIAREMVGWGRWVELESCEFLEGHL